MNTNHKEPYSRSFILLLSVMSTWYAGIALYAIQEDVEITARALDLSSVIHYAQTMLKTIESTQPDSVKQGITILFDTITEMLLGQSLLKPVTQEQIAQNIIDRLPTAKSAILNWIVLTKNPQTFIAILSTEYELIKNAVPQNILELLTLFITFLETIIGSKDLIDIHARTAFSNMVSSLLCQNITETSCQNPGIIALLLQKNLTPQELMKLPIQMMAGDTLNRIASPENVYDIKLFLLKYQPTLEKLSAQLNKLSSQDFTTLNNLYQAQLAPIFI